jgi:hypothetical protein
VSCPSLTGTLIYGRGSRLAGDTFAAAAEEEDSAATAPLPLAADAFSIAAAGGFPYVDAADDWTFVGDSPVALGPEFLLLLASLLFCCSYYFSVFGKGSKMHFIKILKPVFRSSALPRSPVI